MGERTRSNSNLAPRLPEGATSVAYEADLDGRHAVVTYHAMPVSSMRTERARAYFQAMADPHELYALKAALVLGQTRPNAPVTKYIVWADSPDALDPALLGQVARPQSILADMSSELVRTESGRLARDLIVGVRGEHNISEALDFAAVLNIATNQGFNGLRTELVNPDSTRTPL